MKHYLCLTFYSFSQERPWEPKNRWYFNNSCIKQLQNGGFSDYINSHFNNHLAQLAASQQQISAGSEIRLLTHSIQYSSSISFAIYVNLLEVRSLRNKSFNCLPVKFYAKSSNCWERERGWEKVGWLQIKVIIEMNWKTFNW